MENRDNSRFLERAEKLREILGFPADAELAAYIEISPATYYFSIKDSPISRKTWAKLEAAERRASGSGPPVAAPPAPTPREPMTVREPISNDWKNDSENFQRLEKRIERIEQMLESVLDAVNKGRT